MARLESNAKGGFYPIPTEAVSAMLAWLRPPESGAGFFMLDPCAGEGAAARQLAEGLEARLEDVLAVELDEGRAETLRETLPASQVLAPASFFGTYCSPHSIGLAWVNPPYADVAGGGERVEFQFLKQTTPLIQRGGILCWVVPEPLLENYYHRAHLLAHYHGLSAVTFPAKHRRFREVVLFGIKREKPAESAQFNWHATCKRYSGDRTAGEPYRIPSGVGPNVFKRTEPTEGELLRALEKSTLRRHFESPGEPELASPPMSLGKGHIALLLASGHLDGAVRLPGETPHVVRGVVQKIPYIASCHTEETDAGTVTKTVTSEKIALTIRALVATGRIIELNQEEVKS